MSVQEKIVIYDSAPAKICLYLCNLTMPLWGFVAPVVMAGILVVIALIAASGSNHGALADGASMTFYLATLFIVGAALTGLFQDNNLVITEGGLTVPILTSISNRLERFIQWRQFTQVLLEGEDLSSMGSLKIRLNTTDGGSITLGLKGLSAADTEYLLVSISNWLPANILDPKLEQLKELLWNASDSAEAAISYTRMWEDELSSRYSATAYMPLNPGQKLQENKLKVVRQLAFGGWSAIYLVQDSNTSLRVLKESVIPPGANAALKAKALEMFSREAALLIKLDHPRIVKVHDHFTEDGRHYLLLDYINGQNLRQKVKLEGPLHQLDVLEYFSQMSIILQYLHSRDPVCIHRDITPDNIVITTEGKLMLIDFGAANELLGTATGTLVGKQCFISPEQFRGHATACSDLYALGATIYFMLTGQDPEPLTQSSPKTIMPEVKTTLDQLVQKLTSQLESERPQSATDLSILLTEII